MLDIKEDAALADINLPLPIVISEIFKVIRCKQHVSRTIPRQKYYFSFYQHKTFNFIHLSNFCILHVNKEVKVVYRTYKYMYTSKLHNKIFYI